MAQYYTMRGANEALVADALDQSGKLNLSATRSTMRWAAAIEGAGSIPKAYRPDRRLRSPEARQLALEIVERRFEETADPEIGRHRSYLLRDRGAADQDVRQFVRDSLEALLGTKAISPPKKATMKPDAAFELLCLLHEALSAAGMRPFLVSGTLLGQVRNGDLLDYDYDLDVGVLPGDGSADDVAAALAVVPGLEFEVEQWRVWGTHRNGVAFDVFVHYEERHRFYHATRTHAWWNSPFGLVEAKMRGKSFWVPDDVDTYLAENYGDWKAPIAFYHKSFDTPNREYCDTAEALLYLYELVANAAQRKDRFVCESAARELAHNFGIDVRHHFNQSVLLDAGADVSLDRAQELADADADIDID